MAKTFEIYDAQYELMHNILNIIYEYKDTNKELIQKLKTMQLNIVKEISILNQKEKEKSLRELLDILRDIDNSELVNDENINLNSITHDYYSIIVKNAINKASDALISDEGRNMWEFHRFLGENGFYVFPGERDGFGWLTGCIQTRKGYLVYG
jgi:hypothetical protein